MLGFILPGRLKYQKRNGLANKHDWNQRECNFPIRHVTAIFSWKVPAIVAL